MYVIRTESVRTLKGKNAGLGEGLAVLVGGVFGEQGACGDRRRLIGGSSTAQGCRRGGLPIALILATCRESAPTPLCGRETRNSANRGQTGAQRFGSGWALREQDPPAPEFPRGRGLSGGGAGGSGRNQGPGPPPRRAVAFGAEPWRGEGGRAGEGFAAAPRPAGVGVAAEGAGRPRRRPPGARAAPPGGRPPPDPAQRRRRAAAGVGGAQRRGAGGGGGSRSSDQRLGGAAGERRVGGARVESQSGPRELLGPLRPPRGPPAPDTLGVPGHPNVLGSRLRLPQLPVLSRTPRGPPRPRRGPRLPSAPATLRTLRAPNPSGFSRDPSERPVPAPLKIRSGSRGPVQMVPSPPPGLRIPPDRAGPRCHLSLAPWVPGPAPRPRPLPCPSLPPSRGSAPVWLPLHAGLRAGF